MYKKIIILGGSGSGKSTLANRMGQETGLPVFHMDQMLHDAKWARIPHDRWDSICREFIEKDEAIVDGNYTSILAERLAWADLIIFIEVSTLTQIYRFFRRNLRSSLGIDRHYGIPKGAREDFSLSFLYWIYRWNKEIRPGIISMLEQVKDKKVLYIKEPKELDLKSLFK